MPTYEYICEKCGHQFEKFQSIASKPLQTCPEEKCAQKRWGKGKVKRAISGGAGLLFKGSGFYITDYRSDKYKEAAKKETSAPSTSSKSSTSSSGDAKPSAKSAAPKPAKTLCPGPAPFPPSRAALCARRFSPSGSWPWPLEPTPGPRLSP